MTDITCPGEKGAALDNTRFAQTIKKAGGHDGYIVDGVDISQFYAELDETGVNSFAEVSRNGLDVTLDGGEAFMFGWLCRDRQTTVSLPSGSSGTIYVGYDASAVLPSGTAPDEHDNIIIGLGSDFESEDPRLALYDYETDDTSITTFEDVRNVGIHNANSPWATDEVSQSQGRFTIESWGDNEFIEMVTTELDANWFIGPGTVSDGSGIVPFVMQETTYTPGDEYDTRFEFQADNELKMGENFAVQSPETLKIYRQDTEPADAEEGDLWIDTSGS